MTDFDVPGDEVEFDHDLPDERGRWGWYKLLDPKTLKPSLTRRASGFGKVLTDRTALERWGERNAVVGMARRPDLFALVAGKEVKKDRKELDELIEDAKKSAGRDVRSNQGTAVHGFAEQVDCGRWTLGDVPEMYREDVAAYQKTMAESGLEVVPQMIERITYTEEVDGAGKFDRLFYIPQTGEYIIGDLKTGDNPQVFGKVDIGVQLSIYARGVNRAGVWDKRTRSWDTRDPKDPGKRIRVREDFAVVMHLPLGAGQCQLFFVDLRQGWVDAKMSKVVFDSRKTKREFIPFTTVESMQPEDRQASSGDLEGPSVFTAYKRLFQDVTDPAEALALYNMAKRSLSVSQLDLLVQIGREAIRSGS